MPEPTTTVVSTKGQVILPKGVREERRWGPGTRLVVESTPEGVLLTPAPAFPATQPEDVFGCLKHDGPSITVEEMDAAARAEAVRGLPDEIHRALRARAAEHGRGTEAEIREIIRAAVYPAERLKLGSEIAAIARRHGGGFEFPAERDAAPAHLGAADFGE